MIEVADVPPLRGGLPLGSRRVDAALTSARHRGHPQLPHRGTWRPGLALRAMRYRDVLRVPVLTVVVWRWALHKPRVARTPPGGDAAGAALPRHDHRARRVARCCSAHQRDGYAVLMQPSAGAIIELGLAIPVMSAAPWPCSPCCTRGRSSWNLHPHVHCLVSGGGISEDAATWHPARRKFSGSHQGSRQIGARQIPGPPAPKVCPDLCHPGGRVE